MLQAGNSFFEHRMYGKASSKYLKVSSSVFVSLKFLNLRFYIKN